MEKVFYAYPNAVQDSLTNVSINLQKGSCVGVIGESGSGKSTLVSLMLGFYAAAEGAIQIDGVPQQDIDIRQFRLNCAIVMQDNLLLSGTDWIKWTAMSHNIKPEH